MSAASLSELAAARAPALAFYSPYRFLRHISAERQQELFGTGLARRWADTAGAEIHTVGLADGDVHWLLQSLAWDTAYFGTPVVQVRTGLFRPQTAPADLRDAAQQLRQHLAARHDRFYAFSMVPAEDVQLLQALTAAGWRLIETRLTYYRDQLAEFECPRYPVRPAALGEAALISQVAATARNPYDRFHADPWFGPGRADAYLAQYAINAVTTPLAALVLVPDEPGLPVDSFLAISDLSADVAALGTPLSRVLLTAVGPANRGWHLKLVAETVQRAKALGHEAVLMTTQVTNPAVFRTAEKLGFRLGSTTHVLACNCG